jgi:hypothetical protein
MLCGDATGVMKEAKAPIFIVGMSDQIRKADEYI